MQQYQYLVYFKYFWLQSASLTFRKIQEFKQQSDYEGLLSTQENEMFTSGAGSRSNKLPARAYFLPTESVLDKSVDIQVTRVSFIYFLFKGFPQDFKNFFLFFEVQSQLCSTADSFWMLTGDQKSNKQADQILSLLPSFWTHKILPSLQYKGKAYPQSTLLLL